METEYTIITPEGDRWPAYWEVSLEIPLTDATIRIGWVYDELIGTTNHSSGAGFGIRDYQWAFATPAEALQAEKILKDNIEEDFLVSLSCYWTWNPESMKDGYRLVRTDGRKNDIRRIIVTTTHIIEEEWWDGDDGVPAPILQDWSKDQVLEFIKDIYPELDEYVHTLTTTVQKRLS